MILFVNVIITEQRLWGNNGIGRCERGLLHEELRIEVFKYFLASISVIKWSHVYIFCTLDGEYSNQKDEIEQYISNLFENYSFVPARLLRIGDWRRQIDEMTSRHPNDFIWYTGNDDHIFIDSSLDVLNACFDACEAVRSSTPRIALHYSHWDETIRKRSQVLGWTKTHHFVRHVYWDAILAVSPELLRSWFFHEAGGTPDDVSIRRTEDFGYVPRKPFLSVVPNKEVVRHFDGYNRYGAGSRKAPPLRIPPGFFGDGIKIATYRFDRRSYAELRRDGYMIVDPTAPGFSYNDCDGADIRGTLDDIPLFWRDRIAEIRKPDDYAAERLFQPRAAAVLDTIRQHLPLDATTAATLFPAAFATAERPDPVAAIAAAAFPPPPSSVQDDLRVYRRAERSAAALTVVLIDRNQDSGLLLGGVAAQVRKLKERFDIEFVYALIDDAMDYNPACDWVRPELESFADVIVGCRFEHFFDKLKLLDFILQQCHGRTVLAVEWLFSCAKLDLTQAAEAALRSDAAAFGSTPLAVPALIGYSHDPTVAWRPQGVAAGAAFNADGMRAILAGRPAGWSPDILDLAAGLAWAQKGEIPAAPGAELPVEAGVAFTDVRLLHDKLFAHRPGQAEQFSAMRPG